MPATQVEIIPGKMSQAHVKKMSLAHTRILSSPMSLLSRVHESATSKAYVDVMRYHHCCLMSWAQNSDMIAVHANGMRLTYENKMSQWHCSVSNLSETFFLLTEEIVNEQHVEHSIRWEQQNTHSEWGGQGLKGTDTQLVVNHAIVIVQLMYWFSR